MMKQLPSFKQGLPVTIKRNNETITIEKLWVYIRHKKLPTAQFRAVQLDGVIHTHIEGEMYWVVRVQLLHQVHPRKNLLLAERWWSPYDFSDEQVRPLRELCHDASYALSLPMRDDCKLSGSFSQGLPVTMAYMKKSVIIERSRVCIRYHSPVNKIGNWLRSGEWSSVRRDEELPIGEFKAVHLRVQSAYEDDFEVSVRILHRSKRSKNVLLALQSWSYEETLGWIPSSTFQKAVEPLRKMCRDAAKALSLPATEVVSRWLWKYEL